MRFFLFFIAIVLLIGIPFGVHEAGHLLAFRSYGTGVSEYRIFMGPEIAGFEAGETRYSIGIIPLGAYVLPSHEGMTEEYIAKVEEINPTRAEMLNDPARKTERLTPGQDIVTLLFGPLMNFLLAFVIVYISFRTRGYRVSTESGTLALERGPRYVRAGPLKAIGMSISCCFISVKLWLGGIYRNLRLRDDGIERKDPRLLSQQVAHPFWGGMASLSMMLGVLNLLLPIPPLHGGKIALNIYRLFGGVVTDSVESTLITTGSVVFITIFWILPSFRPRKTK